MITSRRSGFLTASMILLFMAFAMISGILTMTAGMDFSSNAIAWHDRQFIEARVNLHSLEEHICQDPRFPDHAALVSYIETNGTLYLPLGPISLKYSNTLVMPWGETGLRFDFAHTVNGRTFYRPVLAQTDETGLVVLRLLGNAY